MTAFLHAHPYILPLVLLACVAVLAVPAYRSGRWLGRWLRGWLQWRRYSRDVGPRHQAPAGKDPFWGDVTWHDTAWDEIRDELGDDYATEAAPCDDPECSQTTHTGQMAALDAEALSLMADLAADGQTRRAENLRLMHAPGTPSYYPYGTDDPTDLPGFGPGEPVKAGNLPDPEETGVAQAAHRVGELTRRIRAAWTVLTGRQPQNLPARAALDVGADGDANLTGQDGRESDTGVLAGEVVYSTPAAAPVVVNIVAITVTDPAPDPWLEAKVAAVRAQIDADAAAAQRELRAWSDSLLAITAGAS